MTHYDLGVVLVRQAITIGESPHEKLKKCVIAKDDATTTATATHGRRPKIILI